jgi:hypothetical protein
VNSSNFNASTINGAIGDVTIRSVVNAFASAFITSGNRVFRKDSLNVTASATVAGAIGRVWFRDSLSVTGVAEIDFMARMRSRSVEVVSAVASISMQAFWWARSVLTVSAAVQDVSSTARIRARSVLDVQARASGEFSAKKFVGLALNTEPIQARAEISITGQLVKPQTLIPAPVSVPAQAFIVATLKGLIRDSFPATATADILATLKGRVRSATPVSAQAVIYASSGTNRQIPFDEPAPGERTFYVPAIDNIFYAS